MTIFIIIYFVIGLVISSILTVINCKAVKDLRKDRYKRYLEHQERVKNDTLGLYYIPCVFELRPWYIDYASVLFATIFDLCLWPVEIILLIVKKGLTKYTYGNNGYFEKYKD